MLQRRDWDSSVPGVDLSTIGSGRVLSQIQATTRPRATQALPAFVANVPAGVGKDVFALADPYREQGFANPADVQERLAMVFVADNELIEDVQRDAVKRVGKASGKPALSLLKPLIASWPGA